MNPKLKKTVSVIWGMAMIGGAIYLVYRFSIFVINLVETMDSDLAIAILAAGATILVSVISVVLGKIYESKISIAKEQRDKVAPVYEELILFMSKVVSSSNAGVKPTDKETAKFFVDFNRQIMVWGSDEVLIAWSNWRKALISPEKSKDNPLNLLLLYEDLICSIRKDLGHKNKGFQKGRILSLFVNDVDDHLG